MGVPWIDPEVKYAGLAAVRRMTGSELTDSTTILLKDNQPVAVLVPYARYLELQALLELPGTAKSKTTSSGG